MLLFLDFDGVLHRDRPQTSQLFEKLPLLTGWLRRRRDCEIIVSSAWRKTRSVPELQALFPIDLRRRILGATPTVIDEESDGSDLFRRDAEVRQWMRSSTEPWRPWAALDDSAHLYRPFESRLVCCDGSVGLVDRDLIRLDEVLGYCVQTRVQAHEKAR